jgi:hypothetical protein
VAQGKKAFIIYEPQTRKVHESRDIHFFEDGRNDSERVTIEVQSLDSQTHVRVPAEEEEETLEEMEESAVQEEGNDEMEEEIGEDLSLPQPEPEVQDPQVRRSTRIRHPPI